MGADVGVDRAVFAQWLRWLDSRSPDGLDSVKADLAALLADTEPGRAVPGPKPEPEPEPELPDEPGHERPSYPSAPPISTR